MQNRITRRVLHFGAAVSHVVGDTQLVTAARRVVATPIATGVLHAVVVGIAVAGAALVSYRIAAPDLFTVLHAVVAGVLVAGLALV